jgi:ABC-type transport system involved in cytochrome bd biosynthesis fused ATPase/permease subunit
MAKIDSKSAAEAILEHKKVLGHYEHKVFYIQEFVDKPGRDIRVLATDGEPVAAMTRSSDHWLTNAAKGGETDDFGLDDKALELVEQASDAVGGGLLGVDLMEVDLAVWRREIGYVPQENLLLHSSVRRNVTLGDDSVPEEEVERALRSAGAWEIIQAMEQGGDTVVGERGTRLSSGQRQRIMIARALLWHPRLLILDEATSSLDPDSDRAIAATLRELAGELTVVVVAHHSALTELADRVHRVERGGIAEEAPGASVSAS